MDWVLGGNSNPASAADPGQPLDRLTDGQLQGHRDELQEQLNTVSYGYYKWSIIGALVAIPLARRLNLPGAGKYTPLLALVSAGTMADYSNAFNDGVLLRNAMKAANGEVRRRQAEAEAALRRRDFLAQEAAYEAQQAAIAAAPKKALPGSANDR